MKGWTNDDHVPEIQTFARNGEPMAYEQSWTACGWRELAEVTRADDGQVTDKRVINDGQITDKNDGQMTDE